MSEKYYSEQEEVKNKKDSANRKGINIGLILFIIGLILAIIGGLICHNTDLNKYFKTKNYEDSLSGSSVKNISIESNFGDMIIKKGTGEDIIIDAKNVSEHFKAEVTGDTLVINAPKTKSFFISVPWFQSVKTITEITLPEREYNNFIITNGLGDIEFSGLKTDSMTFQSGTGDIRLTDMTLGDTNIKNGTGDINITNVTGGPFTISMGTGDLTATGIKSKKLLDIDGGVGDINIIGAETGGLNIDTGTGDTTFKGTVNGNIDIDAGVGDIEVALTNPESDFGINGKYTMKIDKGVGEKEVTYNN